MGDINLAEIPERYFFNSQLKIFQIATDFWESHDSFCDCYHDCFCDPLCDEADSVDLRNLQKVLDKSPIATKKGLRCHRNSLTTI